MSISGEGWILQAENASAASFTWETYREARKWLSQATEYECRAFCHPSDGSESALYLGFLSGWAFFGYQGVDDSIGVGGFWGGMVSYETLRDVFREVELLRLGGVGASHAELAEVDHWSINPPQLPDVHRSNEKAETGRVLRKALRIPVDHYETTLFIGSSRSGWAMTAVDASESFHIWALVQFQFRSSSPTISSIVHT